MQVKIKEIANIQFGYYGQPSKYGTIPYFQAKHFNEFGQYIGENDTFLEEDPKSMANILQDGDVLFVAKGFRFFATLYKEDFGNAIASSIFFVLRPDKTRIIPAYLVSVLNLPKNLLHFQQSGAGSTIPSIRKNELADFTLNLLSLEQQQKVVALQELYFKDIQITDALIREKQKLFQTTISKIIK
ncbi:type I restriction modification DNA specificity protein [Flavobacterium limicola]|uniref:Type I restriction modification DNA specificity protein n=1 Tax=Flavobacterium limicola TaxID=180441 RepID=A0A495S1Z5_9FLAO|nr:restriction endonuclease subunit S [Flavobacterium limicola]RKS93832.1 type I restriction modification DNA specificity protein [Flavobacterium limicola]